MCGVGVLDQVGNPDGRGRIEPRGGLVVQHAVGVGRQCAGDGQSLLLSAAEVTCGNRGGDLEGFQQVASAVPEQWLPPMPAVIVCEPDVVGRCQFVEQGELLEDDADPASCRGTGDGFVVDRDRPGESDVVGVRVGESGQGPHQQRLAGPTDADDQHDAPGGQVQRDVLQQGTMAGFERHVLQRQPCPQKTNLLVRFGRLVQIERFAGIGNRFGLDRAHRRGSGWGSCDGVSIRARNGLSRL